MTGKLEFRNDGPPDYEIVGSFDNFQNEFGVRQVLENLGEKACLNAGNEAKKELN